MGKWGGSANGRVRPHVGLATESTSSGGCCNAQRIHDRSTSDYPRRRRAALVAAPVTASAQEVFFAGSTAGAFNGGGMGSSATFQGLTTVPRRSRHHAAGFLAIGNEPAPELQQPRIDRAVGCALHVVGEHVPAAGDVHGSRASRGQPGHGFRRCSSARTSDNNGGVLSTSTTPFGLRPQQRHVERHLHLPGERRSVNPGRKSRSRADLSANQMTRFRSPRR